jgi:hypothetical protein
MEMSGYHFEAKQYETKLEKKIDFMMKKAFDIFFALKNHYFVQEKKIILLHVRSYSLTIRSFFAYFNAIYRKHITL